jgi:hypothetical protein
MKNKENNKKDVKIEIPVKASTGTPETPEEMINAYGTYNIQPTNNTENDFPAIAQGTPKYMVERPLEFFRGEEDENPASDMSDKHCL